MGFKRHELYGKRIQVDFGLPGGQTYYVNGRAKCLGKRKGDENTDEYCEKDSGYGTTHLGTGRCKFHAGSSLSMPRHGRYSVVARNQMLQHYEEFSRDPNLLNLVPELSVQRTLLAEAMTKYQEEPKIEHLELINKLTNSIVNTVGKIEYIQSQQILTASSARLIMVKAVDYQKRLLDEWFPNQEEENQERLQEWLLGWRQEVEGNIPS